MPLAAAFLTLPICSKHAIHDILKPYTFLRTGFRNPTLRNLSVALCKEKMPYPKTAIVVSHGRHGPFSLPVPTPFHRRPLLT